MIPVVLLLIKLLATGVQTFDTSSTDILPGFQFQELEFSTTEMATEPSTTSLYVENTGKPQALYLDLDVDFASREEYWKANQYECVNGTYIPSKYLRRKYGHCTRIHQYAGTSECTAFCELAASLLLSEDLAPNINLYARFFQIVVPHNISTVVVAHISSCFKRFANNLSFFMDCERPQRFFKCVDDIEYQMV
ncbi:unnamed protein product [Orchesella dallaii]|uniref:Uncharacterized protein n=1 Tax=Orchesella dallaii TaxID=48710 RepID=A0ABP1Q8R8_9HEXA